MNDNISLLDGIYRGKWSSSTITLDNGYQITTDKTIKGINVPVVIRVTNRHYEIMDENNPMTSEEAKNVLQRIRQEGFHYCFESYSDWKEIADKKFHELREKYLKYGKELKSYLERCSDDVDVDDSDDFYDYSLKDGDPVVCTWGYNDITKKPFKFLYDFGYYNQSGKCIVYTHGEHNMQDAHCFEKKEVRKATPEDLKNESWGH